MLSAPSFVFYTRSRDTAVMMSRFAIISAVGTTAMPQHHDTHAIFAGHRGRHVITFAASSPRRSAHSCFIADGDALILAMSWRYL